jgi:hypothetical protein
VTDLSPELTLDDARKLYEKFADKDGGDAVRVMAQIALWGKRQQIEGGRLRLLALRQLGRFLIRNGRAQGRPATPPSAVQIAEAAKTSSADVLPTLASLGIADRHISADAKSVARISQKDFDAYLAGETEPTLKGLLRFDDHARNGRPDPVPSFNTHSVPLAMQGGPAGKVYYRRRRASFLILMKYPLIPGGTRPRNSSTRWGSSLTWTHVHRASKLCPGIRLADI